MQACSEGGEDRLLLLLEVGLADEPLVEHLLGREFLSQHGSLKGARRRPLELLLAFASFRLDKRFVVGHDGALRVNNRLGEYMHAAPPPAGGAAGRSSLPVLGWLEDYAVRAACADGPQCARRLAEC